MRLKKENHFFLLVDCNNFYVSCERVFDPDLRNKPVIILSNNDGCAVAISDEAKKIGIKRGTPLFKIENKIKKYEVRVLSSNYALYGDMSERIMNLFYDFTSEVEIYSIDEAFLKFTKKNDYRTLSKKIKNYIFKRTGIPVSIGAAKTKTLAKAATHFAKKYDIYEGVCDFNSYNKIDYFLKKISVEDIWGIGCRYSRKLKKKNINTAYDLINLDDGWVRENLGGVVGIRMLWELRGFSSLQLEKRGKKKKQIVSSRSFGKDVGKLENLNQAIATYITRASKKLREQNSLVSTMHIFVHTNKYKDYIQQHESAAYKFVVSTDYTPKIIEKGKLLLNKLYKKGYKYKKVGVIFSDIIDRREKKMNLFEPEDYYKNESEIMEAVDKINIKWGKNTIKSGGAKIDSKNNEWEMRRNYLSKRYTTKWDEILNVKI